MNTVIRIICGLLFTAALFGAEPAATLDSAIALFNAKRVSEAREQLVVIVAREPANIQALWYLGRCDLNMQRRQEASDTFAIGYARRGRNALEAAVKLAPENITYREGLVQFYTRAPRIAGGDFDRAYEHIDAITRLDPARGAVIRANTLCSEKRYDEALTACEAFLKTEPDNYLALYTLGRIASETGRELARGEQALRRCLELTPRVEEPDHAGAHYRLGLIAVRDNRPADARRDYEAALALEPIFPEVTEALARLK
jgi:tetratricopeptide (TPR) repeat protein